MRMVGRYFQLEKAVLMYYIKNRNSYSTGKTRSLKGFFQISKRVFILKKLVYNKENELLI